MTGCNEKVAYLSQATAENAATGGYHAYPCGDAIGDACKTAPPFRRRRNGAA